MKDDSMSKEQLLEEIAGLRLRNLELEFSLKNSHSNSTPSAWSVSASSQNQLAANDPVVYQFADLVDIDLLQSLFDSFYQVVGIPYALLDTNNNILCEIGWQDICSHFHRICPQTQLRCQQSDSYIAAHLYEGPYIGYSCLNGLMDYATPIIIEGQHLATIFLGQLLHDSPNEEFFRRQAQIYGFDETAYMEALRKVPIIPKKQMERIMGFYSQLAQLLTRLGLERKKQLAAAEQDLRDNEEKMRLVLEASTDGY